MEIRCYARCLKFFYIHPYQNVSGVPNDYFAWVSIVDENGRSYFEYEGQYVIY